MGCNCKSVEAFDRAKEIVLEQAKGQFIRFDSLLDSIRAHIAPACTCEGGGFDVDRCVNEDNEWCEVREDGKWVRRRFAAGPHPKWGSHVYESPKGYVIVASACIRNVPSIEERAQDLGLVAFRDEDEWYVIRCRHNAMFAMRNLGYEVERWSLLVDWSYECPGWPTREEALKAAVEDLESKKEGECSSASKKPDYTPPCRAPKGYRWAEECRPPKVGEWFAAASNLDPDPHSFTAVPQECQSDCFHADKPWNDRHILIPDYTPPFNPPPEGYRWAGEKRLPRKGDIYWREGVEGYRPGAVMEAIDDHNSWDAPLHILIKEGE